MLVKYQPYYVKWMALILHKGVWKFCCEIMTIILLVYGWDFTNTNHVIHKKMRGHIHISFLNSHHGYRRCILPRTKTVSTIITGPPINSCTNVSIISFSYLCSSINYNFSKVKFLSQNYRERNQDEKQGEAESHCWINDNSLTTNSTYTN